MTAVSSYIAYARALNRLGWTPAEFVVAESFVVRLRGMLGRRPVAANGLSLVMAFPRCSSVHTCFMAYPIDNFSQTYAMAICSLMEMQWQHCCYIHSGEYFHGPFEATEPGVFYFVQLGAGECRPMEERALAFLNTHTDTVMVLDALEYGVGEVPASVRSFLEPIFFYAMSCELRAARGKVFDHSPEVRRYMGIEQY